jgi:signal transduction histidine kinase
MQQGRLDIKKEAFELNETIRRKLISFERLITEKKLNVTFSIFSEKAFVSSDQLLIERVLSNLIDNAVKFTPDSGSIEIKTYDDGRSIRVEVKNTGTEISAEELKRVWERFHKGDASRGVYRNGYGLGLAIVKEIISQLGERIEVSSVENYVSFTFTIEKA